MDTISKKHRSWNMSRIKSKDTQPELVVRSILHNLNYRFRLNGNISKKVEPNGILPGRPDIVLAKYKCCIFVHGCFWHRHKNCKYAYMPKTNKEFWIKKFDDNVKRDKKVKELLISKGWEVIEIWECETKEIDLLSEKLKKVIG